MKFSRDVKSFQETFTSQKHVNNCLQFCETYRIEFILFSQTISCILLCEYTENGKSILCKFFVSFDFISFLSDFHDLHLIGAAEEDRNEIRHFRNGTWEFDGPFNFMCEFIWLRVRALRSLVHYNLSLWQRFGKLIFFNLNKTMATSSRLWSVLRTTQI